MKNQFQYGEVKNPIWANEEKTAIDCLVFSVRYGCDLPFTADMNDIEPHGREIFQRAAAGEFGTVGAFVPRVKTKMDRAAEIRHSLYAIDQASMRPSRAIAAALAAGQPAPPFESRKLAELETQAASLRAELADM